MKEKISSIIRDSLGEDALIYVFDPDGEHFQALVISEKFVQLSLVKQHKLVMNPLREAFNTSVHALQLKTFTPEKWEKEKHLYIN